jgi:S1-C subfamily serine protease
MAPSTQLSSTQYTVASTDVAKLAAGEWGVDLEPVLQDGRQRAVKIIGVRPGSTAARVGAQDGDIIESINGIALRSLAAAYQAGDRARKAGRIVIRGEREGQRYETVLVVRN